MFWLLFEVEKRLRIGKVHIMHIYRMKRTLLCSQGRIATRLGDIRVQMLPPDYSMRRTNFGEADRCQAIPVFAMWLRRGVNASLTRTGLSSEVN
jgi:hypothetical protein